MHILQHQKVPASFCTHTLARHTQTFVSYRCSVKAVNGSFSKTKGGVKLHKSIYYNRELHTWVLNFAEP